ncbi:MAG: hypothetical protein ACK4EY_16245 [Flavipsychrobacter sp.]
MAYILTTTNVAQRLYQEIIDEISRSNTATVQAAIDASIQEAAGYMSRYDIDKVLGTPTTNATITDANLLSKLKDLFVWNFIALAAPNIDYEDAKARYEMAIKNYFQQLGKLVIPKDWPYRDTTQDTATPQGKAVGWNSNPKRSNHY